jgi:hypothetical protein
MTNILDAYNSVRKNNTNNKMEVNPMSNTFRIPNQTIKPVSLADCVHTNYQRPTSNSQVEKISGKFNEAKLGVLTVSLRDGKYHIIDGLHRSAVLKKLGYTHAYCAVLTGMTYEQEAEYFRRQNEDKRIITTFDDFKAGLEAKDELCVKMNEIAGANGFQIGRGNSFYRIESIKALSTIVKDYGYGVLDDTLCLLANTWADIARASQYESLLGVAEFVSRYGMADFSERLKDKFAVIIYDYSDAMRFAGAAGSGASRKKFCKALVAHYNKGLRSNQRAYLHWED